MRNKLLITTVLSASFAFFSCEKNETVAPTSVVNTTEDVSAISTENKEVSTTSSEEETHYNEKNTHCDQKTFTLFAGQHINAGEIQVSNDQGNLYVTYKVKESWTINETHLYVGNLEGLPTNKSNTPIPGKFPFKGTHNTNEFTYTIPLSSISSDCFIIAAHASISQTDGNGNTLSSETAWSSGKQFPHTNRWGSYSEYCKQECDSTEEEVEEEEEVEIIIQG